MPSSSNAAVLRPFLAPLLLRRGPAVRPGRLLGDLCAEIGTIIGADPNHGGVRASRTLRAGGLRLRTIEYLEVRPPAWAPDSARMDVRHHLVVVGVKGDLAAVCCSQSSLGSRIGRADSVTLVERSVVERAFVGTRASVIWMSGVHDPTDVKPAAKTLMGSALEYAIDPLGDQSFFYSAMRSTIDLSLDGKKDASIGANPGGSRLWVGRPPTWQQFARRLEMLLDRAAAPPAPSGLFGMLARSSADLVGVDEAYEVGFVPPELLEGLPDGESVEEIEAWAFGTDLEIVDTDGADVVVRVVHQGVDLGEAAIKPTIRADRVEIAADWSMVGQGTIQQREACLAHLRDGRWIRIRYSSGHTIAGGGCYSSSFRDQRFDWTFVDLTGFDVAKEKPTVPNGTTLASQIGLNAPGQRDDSLFGYVVDRLGGSGWLASDDGAMEIADFVHIADDDWVTLVHVKAAGSANPLREGSASKYEVVAGQAVKNLRHLDRTTLADALRRNQNNQIALATWHAGVRQNGRGGLIARAEGLPPGYRRRAVILQPQLTAAEHDACNAGSVPRDRILRMKQLHTLMLAARLSAGAVGASLEGWAAQ